MPRPPPSELQQRLALLARAAAACLLAAMAEGVPAQSAQTVQGAQSLQAAAAPARVLFVHGEATLRRTTGPMEPQPLQAGTALLPGDALATGAQGRAQLLLADGSRASLQADSRARIVTGAGLDFGAGSLRLQARSANAPFVLETRRGAVRMRGPAFSAVYNPDGSLSIASEREPVEVCTAAGCVTAGDDNVRVRTADLPPTRTNARASWR